MVPTRHLGRPKLQFANTTNTTPVQNATDGIRIWQFHSAGIRSLEWVKLDRFHIKRHVRCTLICDRIADIAGGPKRAVTVEKRFCSSKLARSIQDRGFVGGHFWTPIPRLRGSKIACRLTFPLMRVAPLPLTTARKLCFPILAIRRWHTVGLTRFASWPPHQLPATATENVFHTLAGVFDDASSSMTADGSTTTGTAGTNGLSGNLHHMFGDAGRSTELGIWNAAFSAGNISGLHANQDAYY
jgi:hypothetical protein